MFKTANISECGRFRYVLSRVWDVSLPLMLFVMLNPSTADADYDDPTIRKCMEFARLNGYGGIAVVNLFAFRATKPADLKRAGYAQGPRNVQCTLETIERVRASGGVAVCAWGANARGHWLADFTLAMLRAQGLPPHALRRLADGTPEHPLYIPYACKPEEIPA